MNPKQNNRSVSCQSLLCLHKSVNSHITASLTDTIICSYTNTAVCSVGVDVHDPSLCESFEVKRLRLQGPHTAITSIWMCVCALPGHCTRAHRHHEAASNNHPPPPAIRRHPPAVPLLSSSHRCSFTTELILELLVQT